MRETFLPEGKLLESEENEKNCATLEALRSAMLLGTVLEGIAVRCDVDHNLIVEVGPFEGFIPRTECAMGIAEGTTKEIAILSRVGKPVCFLVTDIRDGTLMLSRLQAQLSALDHLLANAQVDRVIPARVTHMEHFGAFVDIGCGISSMVSIDAISVSRISHPKDRFSVGQDIFALVTDVDPHMPRFTLSHKELLGTWSENAAYFATGESVAGIVRGIVDYGIFIELAPNFSGLADLTNDTFEIGDRVSVFIKALLPENYKVKLQIIGHLPPRKKAAPLKYFITGGMVHDWDFYD